MTQKVTRRDFVKSTGLIGVSLLTTGFHALGQEGTSSSSECLIGESKLETFANNVRSGGVPPDGIPSIDEPVYVSAKEADEAVGDLLKDDSVVFGLNYAGTKIAYPQIIMVWHEIVNEEIDGDQLSVTYCPLTGTAVGFRGKVAGETREFVKQDGNLVSQSDGTTWKMTGEPIDGRLSDQKLQPVPFFDAMWFAWYAFYPETFKLCRGRRNGEDGDIYCFIH
ncbi:MAG: DUF3179 domain-containing (seleno)protein [Candidatus Bipolaricaulota bacterium]